MSAGTAPGADTEIVTPPGRLASTVPCDTTATRSSLVDQVKAGTLEEAVTDSGR